MSITEQRGNDRNEDRDRNWRPPRSDDTRIAQMPDDTAGGMFQFAA